MNTLFVTNKQKEYNQRLVKYSLIKSHFETFHHTLVFFTVNCWLHCTIAAMANFTPPFWWEKPTCKNGAQKCCGGKNSYKKSFFTGLFIGISVEIDRLRCALAAEVTGDYF